jgi:hypothetical protein
MNRTGHVIAAPQSNLAALLKRQETCRTCVYSVDGRMAYIGEGDDVGKRLYQHHKSEDQGGKDFWDRAIVITSKDTNLTKAHARDLESRFTTPGPQASRATLTNSTAPPPVVLSKADVSDMDYFFEQARIVLPVPGVNIFSTLIAEAPQPADSPATEHPTASLVFEPHLKRQSVLARAQEVDGEFSVLEDSTARLKWIAAGSHSYHSLRDKLEHHGTLAVSPDGLTMRFTRSQVFSIPSAAAALAAGPSANGRNQWVVPGDSHLTYGDWRHQGVDDALKEHAA